MPGMCTEFVICVQHAFDEPYKNNTNIRCTLLLLECCAVGATTRLTPNRQNIHIYIYIYRYSKRVGAGAGVLYVVVGVLIGRYWREVVARLHKPPVEWIETGADELERVGWGWCVCVVCILSERDVGKTWWNTHPLHVNHIDCYKPSERTRHRTAMMDGWMDGYVGDRVARMQTWL